MSDSTDEKVKAVHDLINDSIKLGRCIDKIVALNVTEQFAVMAADGTPIRFVMARDQPGDPPMAAVFYLAGTDVINLAVKTMAFVADLAFGGSTTVASPADPNGSVFKPPSDGTIN